MKAELSCPKCGRPIAIQSRKNGERFACPGCISTLTLFDTPQGKRLAIPGANIPSPPRPAASSNVPAQTTRAATPAPSPKPVVPAALPTSGAAGSSSRPAENPASVAGVLRAKHRNRIGYSAAALAVVVIVVGIIALALHKPVPPDGPIADSNAPVSNKEPIVEQIASKTSSEPSSNPPPEEKPPSTLKPPESPAKLSPQEIVKLAEPSVCRLSNRHGGLGTGFVVGPRLIATNEHVLGTADEVGMTVEFVARNRSQFRTVSLAYTVLGVDLVLIRVQDLPSDYAALGVERIVDLQKGEKLVIIGPPRGLENVATEGIFGSVQEHESARLLQLSMAVNPGNSGGPALTDRGKVAGVVTFKFAGEGIGLAIPGDVLQQALYDLDHLPVEDIRKNLARWRARQTGSRMLLGCKLSAIILQGYLRAYLVASEAGIEPVQILNSNLPRYQFVFDQMAEICDDIEKFMLWTKTAALDPLGVQFLEKLEARYQLARKNAKEHIGLSVNDLVNEFKKLNSDIDELETSLKRTYGVMDFQSPLLKPIEVIR